ncbi:MAG: hypothetical protein M1405_01115 [Patescibacteria group bacterium]|nr:hypothetical protein [Patescibacteria group bacterium]
MKFLFKLKPYLPILVLLVIELILFYLNYVPKTYFLGWDNLFPELNFAENLKRSFFAIWEQYRGLGFLDGMSFAANLPHYVFLYITSLVLPQDLLRYFFNFFMHFLGGAGIYFLLKKIFNANPNKTVLSFLGALFYLFNLATIQMFYAPYELFSIHFAFLPWLILFAIKYLENGFKKDLVVFSALSLLSASQANVPTIFIVYFFALFITITFYLLKERKNGLKKALIIIFITISMNSFWGLPYTYYGLTNSKTTINSKINQMSTKSVYLSNKARGDFLSTALFKGFWLDYTDSQSNGKNDYIMPAWRTHTETLLFIASGLVFFFLSVAGAIIALVKKDQKFYPFIFMFIASFLMLGIDIPILNSVFNFFYNHVPLFAQVFRFTFTKFSILYVFSFSILLTLTLSTILQSGKLFKISKIILPFGFVIVLLYYSFPAFQGQFIYKNLRIEIPSDYFQLVNYFKNQGTNERIALLPQASYWGWTYTNWGYRGSGFIWYGLPQASLDGSTFPWSKQNENYYWELDQAVNSLNKTYLEAVLEKYQINWVVLDNTVISQYSPKASSTIKLQKLIESSAKVSLAAKFGRIGVYRVKQDLPQNNFVSLSSNLPEIDPKYQWDNFDTAYLENGDYMTGSAKSNDVFYPFRSLFTGRKQEELEFKIYDRGDYFSFQAKIPQSLVGATLSIPKLYEEEISEIATDNLAKKTLRYPQVFIDNELIPVSLGTSTDSSDLNSSGAEKISLPYIHEGKLEVRVPKLEGYYSYNSKSKGDLFNRSYKNCNPFAKGINKREKISENGEDALRLISFNSNNCFDIDLPSLSQRISYLVTVKSRNLEGQSPLFSIINKTSQKPNFESNLPKNKEFSNAYFIIPPMEDYGLGYNLYFDSVSMGNVKTVNDLSNVEVHQIPYRFLTFLKIEKHPDAKKSNVSINASDSTVYHPNPSFYEIKPNKPLQSGVTLLLSQSYDKDWRAYVLDSENILNKMFPFLGGEELKNHVLVNNWENGWVLDSKIDKNSRIIIVYLPQYLEFLGFLTIVVTLFFIIRLKS